MGLRPVQIWLPDTRAAGFAEEAARQCRLLNGNRDAEVDAWLDRNNEALFAEIEEAADRTQ
jgi:antidote-toxin recognition MazE-like antitoxin